MSDNSIVPKSSLRPNDVLLGRGNGAINYCGNVAFRALVATRRGEYAAAVTETSVTNRGGKTAKARIADEVMQCVLSGNGYDTGVEPGLPGRFLKQASATVLAEAGLGGKQSDQYWIECTRSEAMIKVKMALRQIDRKEEHKEARRVARAGSAQKSGGRQTSSAEAGASAAKRPKANHPSSSELESAPTPSVVASSSFAANALPLMVGHNGAASLGAGSLIAPGLLSAPADSSSLLATMNNPASAGILQALVQQQQLQQQLLISGLIGSVTGASGTGNMLSTLRASVATPPNLGSMVLSASTPNAAASSTSTAAAAPAHAVAASVVNTNSPLVAALRATSESIGGQGNSNLTSFVSKAFNAVSGMVSCHNQSLSFASVLAGNPASQQPSSITGEGIVSGEVIRSDLALFGSLLFEELTGTRPEVDRSALELYDELINKGFPTSLCTLVCCLLDSESRTMDVPPCLSADEVAEDLKFLMENHQLLTDPEVAGDAKSIWDASRTDNLWGRSEQMGLLMDAFKHVVEDGGPLRAVFISGPSGTGKTVMIEHLYEPLRNKNGGLISIKFQELGQKIPLSLIFEGLDQYCTDLLQGDAVRLALTRKTLSETLGSQFYPLYQLIPNLRSVVSTSACSSSGDSDGEGIEGELALNRILVLVRAFIAAIASPEHPVVFVADDLQWSDESSLHLITTILTDTSNCLLFVGLYRDDEVGPDHVLNAEIEKWRTMNMPTVDIRIRNLDLDVVNNMLAYRLKLVPHMTLTLAEIVTQKTDANPLFINELLHSLCSDNLITYFEKERRWKWDDVAIQGRGIADNVVELICGKLRQLAVKSQQILMNAACLGSQSEESSLRLLWGQEGDIDFDLHLALLVTEGLLCKVNEAPVRFSFSHDRIQEAVYARLIPSGERAEMHLNIARILRASELCSDQRVYTVVDQYVRARDLVVDQDERIEVARLCLDAGIKASLAAAFSLSSWCLSRGVQFLCDSDWESEYHLCLRCHSKCAVSQHIIGEHTNALKSLEPVFKYGKTLLDTMESSLTFIEVQSALGNFDKGLESGLELLAQLGQTFPQNPLQSDIIEDFGRVERLRKSTNIQNLMEKDIVDPMIIAAIKALTVLHRVAFRQNQTYCALFGLRGAELTLKSGTCLESTVSFAAMGMLQVRMKRFDEARELAKFTLELLNRRKETLYLPRVFTSIYSGIYPLLEPVQPSARQLRHGYQVGMKMGDTDWGIFAGYCFVSMALRTGEDLQVLHSEVKQLQSHAMAFNHEITKAVGHLLQVSSNLCDESTPDPTMIMPEVPTQEIVGDEPPEGMPDFVHLGQLYFYRLFLSYLFGNFSQAYDVVKARESFVDKIPVRHTIVADETFYTGLMAVAMAKEKGDKKLMDQARACFDKMKNYATQCCHNFEHKQRLLEAEIAVFDCKYDVAASLYDESIRLAGENGFVHEQGLAHEKAGSFYFGLNRSKSMEHFECAKKCFSQWGSPRKVRDLEQRYSLQPSESPKIEPLTR